MHLTIHTKHRIAYNSIPHQSLTKREQHNWVSFQLKTIRLICITEILNYCNNTARRYRYSIHIASCACECVCTCVSVYLCVWVCVWERECVCECVWVCVRVCESVCVWVCVSVWECVSVCVTMCMCEKVSSLSLCHPVRQWRHHLCRCSCLHRGCCHPVEYCWPALYPLHAEREGRRRRSERNEQEKRVSEGVREGEERDE